MLLTELGVALKRVGAKILECRDQGGTNGKWEGTQFKAAADLIADESMRSELKRISTIAIVSEEDVASQSESRPEEYWLIDPIDGTASFVHGFSGFVCQAALIRRGVVEMAGVYAPALDKLYLAERGGGATVNGTPLGVREPLSECLTLVDNYPEARGLAAEVMHALPCATYLESGSIGLKICLVAEGAADLFVKDVTVRDWDVAPPHLILAEAGGFLSVAAGIPFEYRGCYEKTGVIAASTRELLERARAVIQKRGASV
ncbi:inositol monophosphatase family protein [Geomonas propionica]|uniref:Inositol monophosphatase n=1 Tax=Geomonas propionica TaxID=2798582 RepID=A0ABS0YUW8_9BACT|nr:inositol monophosphatase family protein [Geomonas propionica]MBJ6801709.1 hypothetical protein [Geomonas propionica]